MRRLAAEMSVGEARWVGLEEMKRLWKTPPGDTTEVVGSAWMYMLKRWLFPAKNFSHKGAKVRLVFVRKRKAILGLGFVRVDKWVVVWVVARWKRARSSASGEKGKVNCGRSCWERKRTNGREMRRARETRIGDDNIGFGGVFFVCLFLFWVGFSGFWSSFR